MPSKITPASDSVGQWKPSIRRLFMKRNQYFLPRLWVCQVEMQGSKRIRVGWSGSTTPQISPYRLLIFHTDIPFLSRVPTTPINHQRHTGIYIPSFRSLSTNLSLYRWPRQTNHSRSRAYPPFFSVTSCTSCRIRPCATVPSYRALLNCFSHPM